MRELHIQDVEDIAIGAAVLGTGGGGDPHVGKLMATQAIQEYGPVKLVEPEEITDDALVIPSAMMGAPTVLVEKIPSGTEVFAAFQSLENYLGKKVTATMPIEAGGVNSMIPLALAATLRLPVVDCDGMGRAFPELQMVTLHLDGISATPMVLTDEKGNSMLLNTISNFWTERFARSVTVDMGGSAMIAIYPMTGRQVKASTVYRTVSLAQAIGRAIREAKQEKANPVDRLLGVTRGFRLFEGKVVDVSRRTVGGFARGEARIEGHGRDKGKTLALQFQNENLIAMVNGQTLASVPDLITVIDAETARPVTTEGLRYGFRVIVIGIPCAPRWRTPEGLAVVGPRYFGYDVDYTPLEVLASGTGGGQ